MLLGANTCTHTYMPLQLTYANTKCWVISILYCHARWINIQIHVGHMELHFTRKFFISNITKPFCCKLICLLVFKRISFRTLLIELWPIVWSNILAWCVVTGNNRRKYRSYCRNDLITGWQPLYFNYQKNYKRDFSKKY